jgi:hypothetical protein
LLRIKYFRNKHFRSLVFVLFQVDPAEVSEEVTDNSGDGAAHIPAPSPKNKERQKSGKTISSEDKCPIQALNFMRRLPEDFHTFGEYVTMELRFRNVQENAEERNASVYSTNF